MGGGGGYNGKDPISRLLHFSVFRRFPHTVNVHRRKPQIYLHSEKPIFKTDARQENNNLNFFHSLRH